MVFLFKVGAFLCLFPCAALQDARTEFRICAASGIFCSKQGEVVSHDMGGHIAAAVIDEQAGHIFAQWVLNPTLRIPRFIRHQSPGSEQTRSGLALSEVWRRHHRSPTPLAIAFIRSEEHTSELQSHSD